MNTKKLVKAALLLSSSLLAAPAALAAFDTYSKDWPNNPSVVDENVKKPVTVKIAPKPETEVVPPDPGTQRVSENKRVYIKAAVNASTTEVRHIRNISLPPLANKPIISDSAVLNEVNWEVGMGTKIDPVRFEVEYIKHKKINYNPVPLVNGNFAALTSEIQNQALLINMFLDFDPSTYFKPYVGVLTGFIWNKTRSILQGGGVGTGIAKSDSNFGIGWGFSIGARMPFWERWYGFLQYRYTGQSKVHWKDSTSRMKLQGQ
jgi:opacity protein-like surface antigen